MAQKIEDTDGHICVTSNDHFETAPVPKPLVPKVLVDTSLMEVIIYQKFGLGVPFARQEKEWYRLGVNLYLRYRV